jgi:ubiquinone/menaquinone biosynthesis C-methylase UbiE
MDDKELFDLWDKKIKIELTRDITTSKRSVWSAFHNLGHRIAAIMLNGSQIMPNDVVLELGCGSCNFTHFMRQEQLPNYIGLDISYEMLKIEDSDVKRIQGDLYDLPVNSDSIAFVVSIYNLEHLHRLGEALDEIHRVLREDGTFVLVIPMEDGVLYNLGRNMTSRRTVEKKYQIDYMKIIREHEHPNTAVDILEALRERFSIRKSVYLPFLLPSVNLNILAAFRVKKN